jgi:hypothetical protein
LCCGDRRAERRCLTYASSFPRGCAGRHPRRVAGELSKKGIGLSKDEIDHLGAELENGRAALLVMVDENEVADTTTEVTRLGGKAQASAVAPEAVAQAEQALSAAPASTETTPETAASGATTSESAPTDTPTNTPEGGV